MGKLVEYRLSVTVSVQLAIAPWFARFQASLRIQFTVMKFFSLNNSLSFTSV